MDLGIVFDIGIGTYTIEPMVSRFIEQYLNSDKFWMRFLFVVVVLSCVAVLLSYLLLKFNAHWFRKRKHSNEESARFRKRDKALFYGRKMLRKMRNISAPGRKRKLVIKFAKTLLHLKKEADTEQLKVIEPPLEYLQESLLNEERMPSDALFMLQSLRVFGHFEKPIFLRVCRRTETIKVPAGGYLFTVGDDDENVYVVQSGKLNVQITHYDGSILSLKIVKPGESITSLLSFTDVMTGHRNQYKTVSAKAMEDSIVVKMPSDAFREIFLENPEIFIRVMRVIMVRLQRVTLTTLHDYLGLSLELFNQLSHKSSSATKVASSALTNTSPSKRSSVLLAGETSLKTVDESEESHVDLDSNTFSSNDRQDDDSKSSALLRAKEAFIAKLGLSDKEDFEYLIEELEVKDVSEGTVLIRGDSKKDAAMIFIISGTVSLLQRQNLDEDEREDENEKDKLMFHSYPGELVGGLAALTGEFSFFTVKAKTKCRVVSMSNKAFQLTLRKEPKIALHVAKSIVQRLSPFVRQVDFALDWMFIESGRAIYRQDEESDSTYIVLSGRLRSVITHQNGKKELVGEYGKGDLIGIVEMVTHTKRSTTVIAVRDSELAKLPEGLFNVIKIRYPVVVTRLINLLGHRILGSWQTPNVTAIAAVASTQCSERAYSPSSSRTIIEACNTHNNFATVALVAASDDTPLVAFSYELYNSLQYIGSTLRLTSDIVRGVLGVSILDGNNEYRLTSWLAQQEDQHRICLYVCDNTLNAWTQRCIRQADCILIIGVATNRPSLSHIEKEIERLAIRTQKELVLLHKEEDGPPRNTIAWLNTRSWLSAHHHILCPKKLFSRRTFFVGSELQKKMLESKPNVHSDFSRLARRLTGKSVGLVLGGGGAKGSAHVGMIKAIQEAGIPIDMVGGVSIGAFMGGLWCQERNVTTMTQKAREWSKKMSQWWRQVFDLTYPVTSMFSGKHFNQTIKSVFGDTYIEDLWLPYFTVTTDLTSSCIRVHCHGSLWRYVRASMSLSGYMPPLCDPLDGHLLLDGGYTNNLPADIMRANGAGHILAVDVGSEDDRDLTNYGDDLSGWWLLWKKWYPFTEPVKVPNLADIQSRLTYVSCVRHLEEVKNSDYCEYIRPPIDKYRTLQFNSFDEIRQVGYMHGKAYFEKRMKEGAWKSLHEIHKHHYHSSSRSNCTFTDIAGMVCEVSRTYYNAEFDMMSDTSSSDDEFGNLKGYASEPMSGIMEDDDSDDIRHFRNGGSLSLSENETESDNIIKPKKKTDSVHKSLNAS